MTIMPMPTVSEPILKIIKIKGKYLTRIHKEPYK